jgi:hypothetical protein
MCYHFFTTEEIVRTYFYLLLSQLGMEKFIVLFNQLLEKEEEEEEEEGEGEEGEGEKSTKTLTIPFEDKYKKEYSNLEDIELTEEILTSLKNSVLLEHTPLGNVVMHYDHARETFTYYSDSTIPYRYLEVVSRRYVVINNCKKIYVNMDDEIKEAEKKLEEKKQNELKKIQHEEDRRKAEQMNPLLKDDAHQQQPKKSVFAKLKKYNRIDSKPQTTPNPNNSNPKTSKKDETDDKVLKERANRYSCEGKIVNFSFLKKVDRKLVDANYAVSFAEFKKLSSLAK